MSVYPSDALDAVVKASLRMRYEVAEPLRQAIAGMSPSDREDLAQNLADEIDGVVERELADRRGNHW